MLRKPATTEAWFLPLAADPADMNSYRPCLIHSLTSKQHNITYTTPKGGVHHVRCFRAAIYTRREMYVRTHRNIFDDITRYLLDPASIHPTASPAYPTNDIEHPSPGDVPNVLTTIRCFFAATEEVIQCIDPARWHDLCNELLSLLNTPDHQGDVDADDFLLRAQCVLTNRIETGHW